MAHVKKKLGFGISNLIATGVVAITLAVGHAPAGAQQAANRDQIPALITSEMASYADLVALSDASDMVIRAEIRDQIRVKPERAPGLKPGFARLYIKARTIALIAGKTAIGKSFDYVVDVPLDAKGKAPKLKKREVLVFANRVSGRPATVQLTTNVAQFAYSPELEMRLRPVLTALLDAGAPPIVTGVADALAVRGNLVGESETQVFLTTNTGSPVSISVTRRPNEAPDWGVSWGEIIDASASAPAPETLRWYRLACALPQSLPSNANLSRDAQERRQAELDYRYVIEALGPCTRRVTGRN